MLQCAVTDLAIPHHAHRHLNVLFVIILLQFHLCDYVTSSPELCPVPAASHCSVEAL